MGIFKTEEEANNMKELRRTLQDSVDSLMDEADEIEAELADKQDAVLVAQGEVSGLKMELQLKRNEIDRAEKALALIQGKNQVKRIR